MLRHRSGILTIALAGLCAFAGPAAAGQPALDRSWSATQLDPGASIIDIQVAGLAPGRTATLFRDYRAGTNTMVAAVRDDAGSVTPQVLDTGEIRQPALDASFAGGAVAAWNRGYDPGGTVEVAARPPGADAFTPVASLPTCCVQSAPRVAVDERGDAAVVWVQGAEGDRRVMAVYRPAGGAFGAPEVVVAQAGARLRDLAIGADGTLAVSWVTSGQASVAVRTPSAVWSAPEAIGARADGTSGWPLPEVGVDRHGRVVAAWAEGFDSGGTGAVRMAFRPAGGPFGASKPTGLRSFDGDLLMLGSSAAGEVVLVVDAGTPLQGGGAHKEGLHALTATTPREDVGSEQAITSFHASGAVMGMNERGDAVVMYEDCCDDGMALRARRRLPMAAFGPATDMQPPIVFGGSRGSMWFFDADVDAYGGASATWIDSEPHPAQTFLGADLPVLTAAADPVADIEPLPVAPAPQASTPDGPPPTAEEPPQAAARPVSTAPEADRRAPRFTARIAPRIVTSRRGRHAVVRVSCSETCTVRLTGTLAGRRLAAVSLGLKRAGAADLRLAVPRERPRRSRTGTAQKAWLSVQGSAVDGSGNVARATTKARVRLR